MNWNLFYERLYFIGLGGLIIYGEVGSFTTSRTNRLSERLKHPCYAEGTVEYDLTGTEETYTISMSEIIDQLKIEVREAQRLANTFLYMTVREACLNVSFNMSMHRPTIRRIRPRIRSCRDFRAITHFNVNLLHFSGFQNDTNNSVTGTQSNLILAVLFIENEMENEESAAFLETLRRLRYKLYNILCFAQNNETITEKEISTYRSIRDGYLNGMLKNAHYFERSLLVISAIKKLLQNIQSRLLGLR